MEHPDDLGKNIFFGSIAEVLEAVHKASQKNKLKKLDDFIDWFKKIRKDFLAIADPAANSSFFPILRLLLPDQDRERDAYGIRDVAFSNLFIRALGLTSNSPDGQILAQKFDPNKTGTGNDFAEAVYRVAQRRATTKEPKMTVFEFNQHLDNLAAMTRGKDDELSRMVSRLTALEQKWTVRIILKKLRLGLTKDRIFGAYDERAKDLSKRITYLSQICTIIETSQDLPDIQLFTPFKFQLCLRLNFKKMEEELQVQDYFVETKMDGERFQIHREGNSYRYFSKNGIDFTQAFGAEPNSGTLTPRIHGLFKSGIKELILDGEMMVWDTQTHRYVSKTEHGEAKQLKPQNTLRKPCFCAYDILMHNGKCLIDIPYAERIRLLGTLFTESNGTMIGIKRQKVERTEEILGALNQAIESMEEGIVVKSSDARYRAGVRGGGWFKCKPDYVGSVISDLDLLIMGGDYNDRVNRKFIKSWYVGVKEPLEGDSNRFHCIGALVMGFTYEERRQLNEKLAPFWKNSKTSPPLSEKLNFGKFLPDVWIDPQNSVVLQVKSTDLQSSHGFAVPFILHFARVTEIRYDKEWHDCCELREYEDLTREGTGQKMVKLAKRTVAAADAAEEPNLKRRKKADAIQLKPEIPSTSTIPDKIDDILAGKELCVISSGRGFPAKDELKTLIRRHGGKVVENPRPSCTDFLVGQDSNLLLNSYIKNGKYTILKVSWLVKALSGEQKRDTLPPIRPIDVLRANQQFEEKFWIEYDEYGDPFFETINEEELNEILDQMEPTFLTRRELYEAEKEIMGEENIYHIFRLKTARFGGKKDTKMHLARLLFKARGGETVDIGEEERGNLDFVVAEDKEILNEGISAPIVHPNFIMESIEAKKILDFKKFLLV